MHIVRKPKTPDGKRQRKYKKNKDASHEGNKEKATVLQSYAVLPGKDEKVKFKQSSMLQFLKKPSANEEPNTVSTQLSQPSQANQPLKQITQSNSIKLLTSDDAAVEFLTLCAMKASKLDRVGYELNRMDETYLAISVHDEINHFFDYPVPDLDIIDYNM